MQKNVFREREFRDLSAVTTVPEAARLWGIPRRTLYYWCNTGKIAATQPDGGKNWLVSMRSLILVCGQPKFVPEDCASVRD
jgi:excisionase family DNA binding protein